MKGATQQAGLDGHQPVVAKMRKNEGATQQAGLDGHQPAAARRLPPPVSAGHYPGGATTLGE